MTEIRAWLFRTVLCLVAGLWVACPRAELARADLDFVVLEEGTPTELVAGETTFVEIGIRNVGISTWSDSDGDRLAYHWRDAEGAMLVRDGERTRLPRSVSSRERIDLSARLAVPDEPGRYILEWRMVRENVRWQPRPRAGVSSQVEVEVVASSEFAWALEGVDPGPVLLTGQSGTRRAALRNTGTRTWSGQGQRPDQIGYRVYDEEGQLVVIDGARTTLPSEVMQGARVEVDLNLTGPSRPGTYRFELEPVREGAQWYGPPSSGDAAFTVGVEPDGLSWDLLDQESLSALAAGDQATAWVVVANTGTEPFMPDDRLSYRLVDAQGRAIGEGPRTAVPLLLPGEFARVDAAVHAPRSPGTYRLQWELVREHERWFGPPVGGRAPAVLRVETARLGWSVVETGRVPLVWVNGTTTTEVTVRNTGAEPWSEATGDHLAYHWVDEAGQVTVWDGLRTKFDGVVEPGDTRAVLAKVRGPPTPGRYRLQWEMVREHVGWLGPPSAGSTTTRWIRVRWWTAWVQLGFALATIIVPLALRTTVRRTEHPVIRTALPFVVVIWTWLGAWLIAASFAELSGIELWAGGRLAACSGAALWAVPVALAPPRARPYAAGLLVAGLSTLALADLVYMHFFGSIVPLVALTASHHLGEVHASIGSLIEPHFLWLLPAALAGVIAAPLVPRSTATPDRRSEWRRRLAAAGVALAVSVPFGVRLAHAMSSELGQRVFSEQHNAARFGVLNAHVFDFARNVREAVRRRGGNAAAEAEVLAYHQQRAQQRPVSNAPAVEGMPNLLLIQAESLQQWVIGAKVGGQEITPFLNRVAERGRYYPNVFDQTAQGKTSDAEYLTLNSQQPLGEGAVCFLRASNDFHTLAHVLKGRGYGTFSAHPYKRGFWNRAVLHPRYGFDRSMFRRELGPGQSVGWGLADGLFFERVLPELETLPEPWFSFLITLSIHHPYDSFPENLEALELGELRGTPLGNYIHGMNYLDRSFAAFMAKLESKGLAEHTLIALYGDHDARFDYGEHPELLRLALQQEWSPATEKLLDRVPFFVLAPTTDSEAFAQVVTTVGGQVDIAPTLLDIMGVEAPQGFLGHAMVPGAQDRIAPMPDGSASDGEHLFVASGRDVPREGGCFHYPSGRSRPRHDCDDLAEEAARYLGFSRAVVDYDLHRALDEAR